VGDNTFNSLNERWPFPREYHAHLIHNLERAGARQIVFDIEFTELTNEASDSALAEAVAQYDNIILSGKLINDEHADYTRQQVLKPIPRLLDAGAQWGTVNISADGDGFVRRYQLYQSTRSTNYYSIGVLAVANPYRANWQKEMHDSRHYLGIRENFIPKVTSKSTILNYFGPERTFPMYDYADVLDDEDFELPNLDLDMFNDLMAQGAFKDKVVLIGLTSVEFHDTHSTPFFSSTKQLMPGVEIHANFIEMVYQRDYLKEMPYLYFLGIMLILALLLYFLFSHLRPTISIFLSVLLIAGSLAGCYLLFANESIMVPPLHIPILVIVLYFAGLIVHYIKTFKERKFIKQAFGQYIAPELVEELIKDPKKLEYGGQQREITVLFSDVVSFTPYTESHSTRETVELLREHLTAMVDVISRNKGFLDKFVGDEIVAIFGAPVEIENHAYWACKAAFEMRQKLTELQAKWVAENRDPVEIGIGLNSGQAVVGNLGSEQIFDYTGIGDTINAGARIEGLTRNYKTKNNIIISESTYELAKDKIIANFIDETKVKGKEKTINIYDLIGLKEV
jgi:adenylate cyclase